MLQCFKYIVFLVSFSFFFSCSEKKNENEAIVYPVKGHPAYSNQVVLPYTEAIAADVNDPKLFTKRAGALLNINCDSLAIIDLKRAVALDSNNMDYQIILGEVLNDNRLPHQAITYFENVIQNDPQIAAFLGQLKCYILMKKYDLAHELLTMLNKKIPKHPDLKYLECELLLDDTKDTIQVIKDMRAFLSEFPLAINVKMLLAETEFLMNDYHAVHTFNDLFLMDTLDSYPLERIGDFYRQNQDFKMSMQYYRKSVRSDLNYYYGFYKIGELYQESDSLEKALSHYSLAKDINPAFAKAYQGMANVFRMMGEEDSFEVYRRIALRLDPALQF